MGAKGNYPLLFYNVLAALGKLGQSSKTDVYEDRGQLTPGLEFVLNILQKILVF
jgi:hypothetical protein